MIDYNELEKELKAMKPRQRLYELIKTEVKRRGHWKNYPKGKPFKKGYDERRKQL
jgi:hypothetical protein